METVYKVLNYNQIKNQLPARIYMAYGIKNTEVVYSSASSQYDARKKFSKEHPDANFSDITMYDRVDK